MGHRAAKTPEADTRNPWRRSHAEEAWMSGTESAESQNTCWDDVGLLEFVACSSPGGGEWGHSALDRESGAWRRPWLQGVLGAIGQAQPSPVAKGVEHTSQSLPHQGCCRCSLSRYQVAQAGWRNQGGAYHPWYGCPQFERQRRQNTSLELRRAAAQEGSAAAKNIVKSGR